MPQSLPWIPSRKALPVALFLWLIRSGGVHGRCTQDGRQAASLLEALPRGGPLAHRAVPLWGGSGVFYPALGVPEHIALDPVAVQKGVEPFSPNRVIALLEVRERSMGLNALLSPFLE